MRVLVTGVCGFVGSAIAAGLRERHPGAVVVGIDNFIRPGSETSRERLRAAGVSIRHGDIRCASDLEGLPPCDWVIDAAAHPSVLAGVDGRVSSRQLVEHNLVGTLNILEWCRGHGAGLLLLSTTRVYSIGALNRLPLIVRDGAYAVDESACVEGAGASGVGESFSTESPVSLYGATKRASEVMATEYGETYGLPVVVDRCGVIAGAGQFGTAEQGIFSYWIRAWASGAPLTYIGFGGDGHQVRDALHPADLLELVDRQLTAGATAAGVWNVGGGTTNALSLQQLSRWCAGKFGPRDVVADPAPRRWDVPWLVVDAARASRVFDWRPRRGLDDILGEIAAHHRQHPTWLDLSRPYG